MQRPAKSLLAPAECQLLVVDLQERLLPAVLDREALVARARLLLRASALFGVPVTASEQYPAGLGPTVASLRELLPAEAATLDKISFSCLGAAPIAERLAARAAEGRRRLVVIGAETHVCVLQSVMDALERGFAVALAADAVSSRRAGDRAAGIARMAAAGAEIVTTEMVVFEWLGRAGSAEFKALAGDIRALGGDS